ncbi:DNA polymerase, partial [Tepidimonas sp.]|uniref:DNA polymerase n=1 Tax=Tepidimonas sp. TaxID=2002775 RepID=UPI00391DC623
NGNYIWWDAPDMIDRLMSYCDQDVRTECDADAKLPQLTDYEQYVWAFDQVINERGVRLDLPLIHRANALVDVAKKQADRLMRSITGGYVKKVTETGKLAEWITANGVACTSVKKGDMEDIVFQAEVIDKQAIKEAVELRKSANKTSTAKYKAMLECICNDERARGLLAYHAAKTGRWGGRLIQPQNLPRFDQDNMDERHPVDYLVSLLQSDMTIPEIHDCMMVVYGDVMTHLSKALRSMIVAAPDHKLVGGDYSNIEGRVNAWLANEQWKLDAFAAYDAGIGPDLYKVAYAKSFNTAIETVTKAQRQIGKVQELALGYQGGVGAVMDMGEVYNVNPYEIAKAVKEVTSAEIWDKTAAGYEKATDKSGLQEREWTAIKIIVNGWRAAHPGIVQS